MSWLDTSATNESFWLGCVFSSRAAAVSADQQRPGWRAGHKDRQPNNTRGHSSVRNAVVDSLLLGPSSIHGHPTADQSTYEGENQAAYHVFPADVAAVHRPTETEPDKGLREAERSGQRSSPVVCPARPAAPPKAAAAAAAAAAATAWTVRRRGCWRRSRRRTRLAGSTRVDGRRGFSVREVRKWGGHAVDNILRG